MNVNNEPKWVDFESTGEFTGEKYFGRFCIKPYLTNAERADVARLAETYCRGITEDATQRGFLTTLAFLKFHLVETDAKWWVNSGLDMFDEAPAYALAAKVSEVQKPKKAEEKSEGLTKS